METRKLYYEDCHLARFTARVLSCDKTETGFAVVLDATAFYPEGGGQAADTGTLGNVRVLDTRERGGQVVHLCGGPLTVGDTVEGVLDWEPRFRRMQQHTGEHIVSGILHRRYGCHNTGFHMGAACTTIDFDAVIPPEDLPGVEAEANRAVWENLAVRCSVPAPEELAGLAYRTKRALPWPVRIVEVPGFDRCACCGVHVAATGEIGVIKLLSSVPFRGGTRIEMACGAQAMELLNAAYEQNRQVSQAFSVQMTETGEAARRMNELLSEGKYRASCLERRIFRQIAAGYAGGGDVLHFEDGLESGSVRELADAIAEVCGGTAAVFSGGDGEGYAYCLVARQGDLRPLGRNMNQVLNGRGGGKPAFQQGRVRASRAQIEAFFGSETRKVI